LQILLLTIHSFTTPAYTTAFPKYGFSSPQRRGAPRERRSSTHAESPTASSVSTTNSDAQNSSFVLNNPQPSANSSTQASDASATASAQTQTPSLEARTCWICQQDATDDTPETSEWRRPCPCSLTAHDECLMEWITSNEAPKPGEMATPQKIVCPVCQAPIQIERPRDLLVMLADMIQKVAKGLVVPTALSALIGCFYSGFLMYGLNAMDLIFGPVEARRLLMPSSIDVRAMNMAQKSLFWKGLFRFFKLSDPFMPLIPGVKLCLGLPLIAPSLVLARTRIADHVFAILPISYFIFNPTRRLDLTNWPPSPALTLAVLPYIRTTYNELYKHTFSNLEKQWDTAVQRKPREGETPEQIAAEQQGLQEENGFLDIEVEVVERGDDVPEDVVQEDLAHVDHAPGVAPEHDPAAMAREGLVAAQELREQLQRQMEAGQPLDEADARQLEDAVRDARRDVDAIRVRLEEAALLPPQNGRRRNGNNGWEIRQNISTAQVASTVMGALFFPAISSVMGDLLKAALPVKWVSKEQSGLGVRVSSGLLKEKWGRSIIGGCLFVVLKDAITLYCKWKKARDFGKKKILDYVGERKHA
ncbi:Membrane-associated RING finger 5, partial [Hyphodiscus hymeniophilus]